VVVGVETFGKGSVQTVMPLRNGAALRLTTSLYYTPSGRSIQAKGIEPDIVVERELPRKKEDERGRLRVIREEDLKNHMDGKGKTESEIKPDTTRDSERKQQLENDNQLARALEVLKSWEILSQMKYAHD
jgi:carboxyl-terminal processing protease